MIESILGVDHVGLGVRDGERMKSFYRDALGFTRILAEMPEEDHPALHGLLRADRTVHSATLLGQDAGDMTLALFQATEPIPRAIRADHRYGDIGVAKLTFAVNDLTTFCRDRGDMLRLFSSPKRTAFETGGDYHFAYGRDPEGNLIEVASGLADGMRGGTGSAPEGVESVGPVFRSVGIAVTDLERSQAFYRDVLGFRTTVLAPHERFSGLVDELTGIASTAVRSCLLANPRGNGMLELFEVTRPRGRSIPFGTQWGDFGYLQVCLAAEPSPTLAAEVEAARVDVLLPLQAVDDPERPAKFMYLRDPDGIPVELVAVG